METRACAHCATNRIYQGIITGYTKTCPTCQAANPVTILERTWCESVDHWQARAFAALAPVEVVEAPKVEKVRCPHYATIKAFFQAARQSGLDTISEAGKDRCRGALGIYLQKRIGSRAELTACDWENGITGVKAGVLFW
jgi:hypothetical protein